MTPEEKNLFKELYLTFIETLPMFFVKDKKIIELIKKCDKQLKL